MIDRREETALADRDNLLLIASATVAAIWLVAQIQWMHALHWDEIEFFRATKWLSQGRLPYRDFWEHHTPLQWFVFAPVARLISGAGANSVIALRWAQLPIWLAGFVLLERLSRHVFGGGRAAWMAIILLVSSHSFTRWALEYRVDTLGSVFFLAGLALSTDARPKRLTAAGVFFALAVLANLRLAPMVIAVGLLLLFLRLDERRWGWNGKALWLACGAVPVAALAILYAEVSGTTHDIVDGLFRYNSISNQLINGVADTLVPVVVRPFGEADIGVMAIMALALVAIWSSLRDWRRPDVRLFLVLITAITVVAICSLGVHYGYHLQLTFLLLTVLAAGTLPLVERNRPRFSLLFAAIVLASIVAGGAVESSEASPALLAYQNTIMQEVNRQTSPREKVWDGCGFALDREPAYRYWFLPAGVRVMAQHGLIPRYGARELASDPPAAIIMNDRTIWWLQTFPDLIAPVVHEFVPLYRNLWVPGLSARLDRPGARAVWRIWHDGRYRVYASDLLARHLWFKDPREYLRIHDRGMAVPLRRLAPVTPEIVACKLNGAPVDCRVSFTLRRGDVFEMTSASPLPLGVLVVDPRFNDLFITPDQDFVF